MSEALPLPLDAATVASIASIALDSVRQQTMADHDVLLRVDEKLTALHARFDTFERESKAQITEHQKEDNAKFVTKEDFRPVKLTVYGLVGTTLAAVLAAIISQVVR